MRSVLLAFVPYTVLMLLSEANAAESPSRPDILVIMPDQWRGDCLSILDHPVVQTPHIDALARQGVLFRRAYSTIPSCIPARHALLTGQFPQTSGIVGFRGRPITCPTMPGLLHQAGYTTVLVGREMHQTPYREPYGFQTMILGSTHREDDEYCTYFKQVTKKSEGIRKQITGMGVSYNGWEACPWPLADEHHPTAWVVRQARKVVRETPGDQRLFLTASFYAPHPPLFPPSRLFEAYRQKRLPQPAHGDWVDWKGLSPTGDRQGHRVLLEGEPLRRAQAGYFGLMQHLDEQVAPLIDEFCARSRQASRPWVIVFTTDHGEMLGDHGYFRKCQPYEGAANIPLIIAGSPELQFQAGLRLMSPACLEDIMPTLLGLAGVERPGRIDGVNLTPALRGSTQPIRPWLHMEHAPCYSKEQAFHSLTDGHFKYIWRPLDGAEQLFDLDHDPREEHDLAPVGMHRQRLEWWRGELIGRLAKRPEGFSDGTRLIPGREYRPQYTPKIIERQGSK